VDYEVWTELDFRSPPGDLHENKFARNIDPRIKT